MATIRQMAEQPPLTINNFYGLNIPVAGDTQISLGESGNMYNCYITKDYNVSKIEGYLQQNTSAVTQKIQGMWYGNVGGTNYFLYAQNGHIYKQDSVLLEDSTTWDTDKDDLGTLTDATTSFFAFREKVYILNGSEYKYWDGTTFGDVTGYVPKTYIGCNPTTGSGTVYELLNVLNGKRRLTYHGDGTTKVYKLPEQSITSVDYVYVGGVLQVLTTHYSVSTVNGTVTFVSAPATGLDNVQIYYTKGTGNREIVYKNRFAYLFGEAIDTRVFLYGNADNKNVVIHSSLADGVSSAEYFTVGAPYIPIGSSSTAVTGIARQQNIMLIFKENETYYTYPDSVNLDGQDITNFPVSIINDTRGNIAKGQTQVLNNDPFSLDTQLLKWYATSVKDERNMKDMGQRIQKDLDLINIADCLTIDIQNKSELWISNLKKIWIYKYDIKNLATKEQGTFSRLYINDTPSCFLNIDNNLYFGTTDGKIMKFSDNYLTFNGTAIDSHWEMNMYNFGTNTKIKTLNKSWVVLSARPKVSCDIQYVTEKNAYSTPYSISFTLTNFDDVDFRDYNFYTNYNPRTFNIRLKAKKFVYLKLIIDNSSTTTTFSLLSLSLKVEYGGETK